MEPAQMESDLPSSVRMDHLSSSRLFPGWLPIRSCTSTISSTMPGVFLSMPTTRKVTGSITDLYPAAYRTDYRNYRMNNGILPVYRNQSYSLYGEYKSTVREFFPPCRSTITGDGPTVSSNSRSATGKSRLSPTACPTILPAGR